MIFLLLRCLIFFLTFIKIIIPMYFIHLKRLNYFKNVSYFLENLFSNFIVQLIYINFIIISSHILKINYFISIQDFMNLTLKFIYLIINFLFIKFGFAFLVIQILTQKNLN